MILPKLRAHFLSEALQTSFHSQITYITASLKWAGPIDEVFSRRVQSYTILSKVDGQLPTNLTTSIVIEQTKGLTFDPIPISFPCSFLSFVLGVFYSHKLIFFTVCALLSVGGTVISLNKQVQLKWGVRVRPNREYGQVGCF